MKFNLDFPDNSGRRTTKTLTVFSNIVLVGANGAGKTRLGVKIESLNDANFKLQRITAQKALGIPESTEPKNLDEAEKGLLYGTYDVKYQKADNKDIFKWNSRPATFLLDDYGKLLSLLFAKTTDRDRNIRSSPRKQVSINQF
jgi:hypothetical protein